MKYNHYSDDPSLFTGEEEVDEDLTEYYEMLAGMAEEIIIRTDANIKIEYDKDTLTIQAKEETLTPEARDFIEQYRKAMPKISILFS